MRQADYLATDESGHESIRPLQGIADGIALVDLLNSLTPADHDLFDLLEKIELKWNIGFGEWRDTKDINGSLRTYAFWEQREHSKEASLVHPAGNRANIVMQVNDLFGQMPRAEILEFLRIDESALAAMAAARTESELLNALPTTSVLARLFVENHYTRIFLNKRPGWLERLFGDHGPEYRQSHRNRLATLTNLTEQAVLRCLRKLIGLARQPAASTSLSA